MTTKRPQPIDHTSLVDQVVASYLQVVEAGGSPDPQPWLARYPELADDLRQFFAAQKCFEGHIQCDELITTETLLPETLDYQPGSIGPVPLDPLTLRPAEARREPISRGSLLAGRYRVFAVKAGGMGIVYLADEVSMHGKGIELKLALKTVADYEDWRRSRRAKGASDDRESYVNLLRRFHREAEACVRLGRHPNIIWALQVLEIGGKPYLVTEYADSGDLASWIAEGRVTVALALNFAVQFCEGMTYAVQTTRMVHRDIKPPNVLIHEGRVLKITDFGLAKANDPQAEEIAVSGEQTPDIQLSLAGAGTLPYMPPEQFHCLADADTRSDVFSFGATLYEMLTGRRLFVARDASQHLSLRSQPVPEAHRINPQVPPELSRLVIRCVSFDPDERYQTFEEIRCDLWEIYGRIRGRPAVPQDHRRPPPEDEVVNQTYSLLNLGHWEKAVRLCNEALRWFPRNAALLINKGSGLRRLQHFHEAKECFQRAAHLAPSDPLVWANLSWVNLDLGCPETALKAAQRAIDIDALLFDGWFARGCSLESLDHWPSAAESHRRATELRPYDWGAQLKLGVSLLRLGRHVDALPILRRATELNPQSPEPWNYLAGCLHDLDQHEEALRAIDRSLTIDPASSAAWTARGMFLWQSRSDRAAALACYRRALQLDPENRHTRSLLTKLEGRL